MPIDSREKGQRGERELAKMLREFGIEAERGQQRAGSAESPDVKHSINGLHIEVKRVEKLNIWSAMAQAVRDAGSLIPSVWYRRNHGQWWVAIPAKHFLWIIKLAGMI